MASTIEQTETKKTSSEARVYQTPSAQTPTKPPLRRDDARDKPEVISDWASI